jgi:hypothetical protein
MRIGTTITGMPIRGPDWAPIDSPFEVVRTNGGDEVLARAANLLCQRGRQLVTLRSSWHSEPQPRWASGGPDVALMIG